MVEKKKFKLWEKIFVGLSALMVLIVVIVYGTRFIHYYMIEHPKAVDNSIAEYIKRNRTVLSGDGLYTVDESNYYFYGKNTNNYLWYSGRLWQIVDINPSGIKLIPVCVDDPDHINVPVLATSCTQSVVAFAGLNSVKPTLIQFKLLQPSNIAL